MTVFAFVHALPNAWFPVPNKSLVLEGISAEALSDRIKADKNAEIVSHVRYEDHAHRISTELRINLPSSGVNAPSPYNFKGYLVVASLTPGTTQIQYVLVHDGTKVLEEAGVWS